MFAFAPSHVQPRRLHGRSFLCRHSKDSRLGEEFDAGPVKTRTVDFRMEEARERAGTTVRTSCGAMRGLTPWGGSRVTGW
ncbi:hypothetical protein D7X12_11160 [Corallococcus sicarius]|uniref:Uncharacterized protein n=1 Tax=Corallococcus sicarius TaxID=2316726 RepID=A0A3A8NIK2_9BACT|nr:hypothetical protein D7X12_11160 [Corallococcus sicarius]